MVMKLQGTLFAPTTDGLLEGALGLTRQDEGPKSPVTQGRPCPQ